MIIGPLTVQIWMLSSQRSLLMKTLDWSVETLDHELFKLRSITFNTRVASNYSQDLIYYVYLLLLFSPLASQLFTSSMVWCSHYESIEEYYDKCVGVHPYLLPTVLGLKLAVDFDLGSRCVKCFLG